MSKSKETAAEVVFLVLSLLGAQHPMSAWNVRCAESKR